MEFKYSKSTRHDDKADIADADEAMPLLWGKLFFDFIRMSWLFKNLKYFSILEIKSFIFWPKGWLISFSNSKIRSLPLFFFGLNSTEVVV